jgi:hypothetical protein
VLRKIMIPCGYVRCRTGDDRLVRILLSLVDFMDGTDWNDFECCSME